MNIHATVGMHDDRANVANDTVYAGGTTLEMSAHSITLRLSRAQWLQFHSVVFSLVAIIDLQPTRHLRALIRLQLLPYLAVKQYVNCGLGDTRSR